MTPAGLPDKVTVNGQAVDVGELGPAAQAAEALAAYKQAWLEHCLPHVQKIMASDYEHAEAHHTNTNFSVHMDHRTKEWMDAQTKKIRTRLHKNAGCDGTGAKRKAAA